MASAKIQRMSKSGKNKPGQTRSTKSSEVPDEIQCKICKKRYEDPKILSCLHTFCKACLEESLETHNGVLYCPVCPAEMNSTDMSDVNKLQSNFMISNLLEAIDLKRGLGSKLCNSCEEGVSATSRCFECSDFLCGNCVEAHKRVRFTKNHRIVAIKNLGADSMVKTPTCATHVQEAVKMYCKRCKKPVCRSCLLNEHDEHLLVSLKEAVEETKPKLNTLLVATRARIPILQRKLKGVHASKEKLETKVDEVIKEIQATSARILMAVKRREKDLYKMLRRIHDQKSDDLEGRELALENDLAQVLDSCDFAEELGRNGDEGMVLHLNEMTCARLRYLSGKEDEAVPGIAEDEIEYSVEEKPVLDQLKIYGRVLSKEQKAKKEEKEKRDEKDGKSGNSKEKQKAEEVEEKKPMIERRQSWLQTLVNPRALIRRLSFGGDEMEDKKPEEKKPEEKSPSKEHDEDQSDGTQTPQQTQAKNDSEQQQQQQQQQQQNDPEPRRRADSVSKSEQPQTQKREEEHVYAMPNKPKSGKSQNTIPVEPSKSPPLPPRPESLLNEPATVSPNDPNQAILVSPRTHSILKQSSPQSPPSHPPEQSQEFEATQAWTIRGGSVPSGAHSQSYLPSLCILTKNRRGRPREVEIQLESPDKSIVSAQILDHKNGTYTIFYCPLTHGEHNLYVNLGGKNIKHGKKVLNFYGKFSGMGAEELFLARRVLSCIRWQVTPGFVELKDKKLKPNHDI
ncbi:tripartite motif-containing protein 45-like [Dendronephthya gigantea]|uniref:tripartite motif-containing protein 45-like n=1 Tax=Dendronephthya gigantea TaxID=151771 RepID=UPI00106B5E12|nr:tripartite motif-containing protein 45-like [Dendronephthya gigantea]